MKYMLFLFFSLLCGCSPINTVPAKQEVKTFHELYQSEKYTDIYRKASSDFKEATSEKRFIDIMTEAKEKHLGAFKKSTLKLEQNSRNLFSKNEISLMYYSEFSKRIVKEVFIFEIDNGSVKLKGYRYDSII